MLRISTLVHIRILNFLRYKKGIYLIEGFFRTFAVNTRKLTPSTSTRKKVEQFPEKYAVPMSDFSVQVVMIA